MPPCQFPQPHLPGRHCQQQATHTVMFLVYDRTAGGPQWSVQERSPLQKRRYCLQHAHSMVDRLTVQMPPRPREG